MDNEPEQSDESIVGLVNSIKAMPTPADDEEVKPQLSVMGIDGQRVTLTEEKGDEMPLFVHTDILSKWAEEDRLAAEAAEKEKNKDV